MAAPSASGPARVKAARTVRLILRPTATMPGVVRIQAGREPWTDYNIARIPSDFGTAFRLVKLPSPCDCYDVLLNGIHSTCECKGFRHRRHCKHVEGLAALRSAGRI
jgi:hypothetical protein